MGKITGGIVTGIFLIITLLGFIPQIPEIQKTLGDEYNQYIAIAILYGIVIGFIIGNLLVVLFLLSCIDYIVQRISKKKLDIKILEDSKLYLGGDVRFEANFKAFLKHGYFEIRIQTPYLETESSTSKFDLNKKLGELKGDFKDDRIKLKCLIPEKFSSGQYEATIRIVDVLTWMSVRIITRKVILKTIKFDVAESKNQ